MRVKVSLEIFFLEPFINKAEHTRREILQTKLDVKALELEGLLEKMLDIGGIIKCH